MFTHAGMKYKGNVGSITLNDEFFNELPQYEKEKFIMLIDEANTRENTVEIQCAIYMNIISHIMKQYVDVQEMLNGVLADMILLYEEKVLTIAVEQNSGQTYTCLSKILNNSRITTYIK